MSNTDQLFPAKKSSYCFRNLVCMQVGLKILITLLIYSEASLAFLCNENKTKQKIKKTHCSEYFMSSILINNLSPQITTSTWSNCMFFNSEFQYYMFFTNQYSWLFTRVRILILDKFCFHFEDKFSKESKMSPPPITSSLQCSQEYNCSLSLTRY